MITEKHISKLGNKTNNFPRQRLKIYFSCQIKGLNIFLVKSSFYRKINLT